MKNGNGVRTMDTKTGIGQVRVNIDALDDDENDDCVDNAGGWVLG